MLTRFFQTARCFSLFVCLFFIGHILRAQTITSFIPKSGAVGTLITITGSGLANPTAFTIGGVSALVISNNGTTLVGMLMPGATTGNVTVTTVSGTVLGNTNFNVTVTSYPNIQQGNKLFGTGVVLNADQGYSVAISADGNTAIIGGSSDNKGIGAAWVFVRKCNMWVQQGSKLLGNDFSGSPGFGKSIAISADGNTAIIGGYEGYGVNGNYYPTSAGWIFVRNNGAWSQQGGRLICTGFSSNVNSEMGVSISADGNTAIIGNPGYNSGSGGTSVFVRNAGTWIPQGNILVGNASSGFLGQGNSLAISADGNTILTTCQSNNTSIAAWVFVRNGNTWTQQGSPLIGSGYSATTYNASLRNFGFGYAAAISADGNTAMIGGPDDNNVNGAVWVFTRNAGIWSQQGNKLTVPANVTNVHLGSSISLSADGNTAAIGGDYDNKEVGAVYMFTRNGSSWTQKNKLVGNGFATTIFLPLQGASVALSADGSTLVEGGYLDNGYQGATWAFVDSTTIPLPAKISITTPNTTICSNTKTTFISTTTNAGVLPIYQWKKNGINVGTSSTSYIDSALNDKDSITCTITTGDGCFVSTSNAVTMTVNPSVRATISVVHSPDPICPGATVTFTAVITNGGLSPRYQWQKNGANVGNNSPTYIDNSIINGTKINCNLYTSMNCVTPLEVGDGQVMSTVKNLPGPVDLGTKASICQGSSILLDAKKGYVSYLWQDNSANQTFVVSAAGVYFVTAKDSCGTNFSDTILVSINPTPANFLPADTAICPNETIVLKAGSSYNNYLWSNNSTSSSLTISSQALYWLQVTDNNNCVGKDSILVSAKDCIYGFYVPTAFTPNGDGKNDIIKPFFSGTAVQYQFAIYDRFGQKIFLSTDPTKGWDGTINGIMQKTDTYIWTCAYQLFGGKTQTQKGTVVLVR